RGMYAAALLRRSVRQDVFEPAPLETLVEQIVIREPVAQVLTRGPVHLELGGPLLPVRPFERQQMREQLPGTFDEEVFRVPRVRRHEAARDTRRLAVMPELVADG